MDGAEFFFEGVRRLDWGLGNPNKTAAMIAEGMVAVWALAYVRQRLFWFSAFLFTALGCCLVQTFSRGGLVACCAGLAVLAVFAPRPWPRQNMLTVVLSATMIAAYAVSVDAHRRYTQGFFEEDRSVTNRIVLWQAAPAMMADAPWGWGIGNAGRAYMRWYQPVDRCERYRTLVNSHLTWLVELGWPLRFLYLCGWMAIFLLCGAKAGSQWRTVPCGIWAAFATASSFSSVAESPWLWVVPMAALLAVFASRARSGQWPPFGNWLRVAALSVLFCVSLWAAGRLEGSRINGGRDRVVMGSGTPMVWLVADEESLGETFAKTLRKNLSACVVGFSVGIVTSLDQLPRDVSGTRVVLTGAPAGFSAERMGKVVAVASRLVLLAPAFFPQEAGFGADGMENVEVVFGEFSQSPFLPAWEKTGRVHCAAATGDYFPDWPEALCGRRFGDGCGLRPSGRGASAGMKP